MIVLDASAAIEMARQTENGLGLRDMISDNEEDISCSLFGAEAASVVRKLKRTEQLSDEDTQACYDDALGLVDRFHATEELQHEAFREAASLDRSVYDMFYFVLARRTGATLFFTDQKLLDLCAENGVDSIEIIDDFFDDLPK